MNCVPAISGNRIVCSRCKRLFPEGASLTTIAQCKVKGDSDAPDRLRLGSAIKAGLDAIGITQDRVAALVKEIGLPPSCGGCAKRQEQLDEFDRRAEAWLKKAAAAWRGEAT